MISLMLTLAAGRVFFVSPTGDDANDGLSKSHAWKTLVHASKADLRAGDEIVLLSGATFRGSLDLDLTKIGAGAPVVVRSSGAKPATIVSPDRNGVFVRGGGVTIRDLVVKGEATKEKKEHGGIIVVAPGSRRERPVLIERVDVSGFGDSGIGVGCEGEKPNGFDGITIRHARVHGNHGTGIITWDRTAHQQKGFASRNLVVEDCDSSENLGGSGIIVSGVEGGRVEFCRAVDNAGPGGGVAIWSWSARRIAFRHCIAGLTHTGGKDGGGFDLDGGSDECVVERCLSFGNEGPGYMHCDYPSAPRTQRNAIRDSVSLDDGRKKDGEAIGFGFVTWGSGLYDCTIERNLAIVRHDAAVPDAFGALFAYYIRSSSDPVEAQKVRGCVFRDNRVRVEGKGIAFLKNDLPDREPGDVTYVGNRYFSNVQPPFLEGEKGERRAETPEAWRKEHPKDAVAGGTMPPLSANFESLKTLRPRDLPKWLKSRLHS